MKKYIFNIFTIKIVIALMLTCFTSFDIAHGGGEHQGANICSQILDDARDLLERMNANFSTHFYVRETEYWKESMGRSDADLKAYEKAKENLSEYLQNPENLKAAQKAARQLQQYVDSPSYAKLHLTSRIHGVHQRLLQGIDGFSRLFELHVLPQDGQALKEYQALERAESEFLQARKEMVVGYVHPAKSTAEKLVFIASTPNEMALIVANHPDESLRMAAFAGLRKFEKDLLQLNSNAFIKLVIQRNRFARSLGFANFYEYKLARTERMTGHELFSYFDQFLEKTHETYERLMQSVSQAKGESALQPWNFAFVTRGDLTAKVEKYFPLEEALKRWAISFYNLGIDYRGALVQMDLIDRRQGPGVRGKRNNGFMQGPRPALLDIDNLWRPAEINISANAIPGQLGAGQALYKTLFHEGGHAAHFANQRMPAVAYTHEYEPTSIAFAETQSIFMDNMLNDPDWLSHYAKTSSGESMPEELIRETVLQRERFYAREMRTRMLIPYFEWSLYQLADDEITTDRLLNLARDIEYKIFGSAAPRPILTVNHLQQNDSSAYSHAYVLAQMAVDQTVEFFRKNYGGVVDNPKVGKLFSERYWETGNLYKFTELIERMTGQAFSFESTVNKINHFNENEVNYEVSMAMIRNKASSSHNASAAEQQQQHRYDYSLQQMQQAIQMGGGMPPQPQQPQRPFQWDFTKSRQIVDEEYLKRLNLRLVMVNGDQVISSTETPHGSYSSKKSLAKVIEEYEDWVSSLMPKSTKSVGSDQQ